MCIYSRTPQILIEHPSFPDPGLGVGDTTTCRMDKVLDLAKLVFSLGEQKTDK